LADLDRIFAIATPPGRSGIAVMRVSGPGTRSALSPLCGELPRSGRTLRFLRDENGELIDQALVLIFPEGASFTGEEVVELHVHGGVAISRRLSAWLSGTPGFRHAEAGEFTRRAMENGLLDIAQIEGLADLIDAETEAQRRQAVRLLAGDLGRKVEAWRSTLLEVLGILAACIDFSDQDISPVEKDHVGCLVRSVRDELWAEAKGALVAERIRDGFEVAIVGRPNVGKSTLLNRLAGRSVSLTSEIAGTTRDVIEVRMDLGGIPVTFLDTAGFRDSSDELEALGIERARVRSESADIRVHLIDAGCPSAIPVRPGDMVLLAKGDTIQDEEGSVSGLTGAGVDRMLASLQDRLAGLAAGVGSATRERHRVGMLNAAVSLQAALVDLEEVVVMEDLVAEDVRLAISAIDSLVARVDVEEVLGWVFSRFCIGK